MSLPDSLTDADTVHNTHDVASLMLTLKRDENGTWRNTQAPIANLKYRHDHDHVLSESDDDDDDDEQGTAVTAPTSPMPPATEVWHTARMTMPLSDKTTNSNLVDALTSRFEAAALDEKSSIADLTSCLEEAHLDECPPLFQVGQRVLVSNTHRGFVRRHVRTTPKDIRYLVHFDADVSRLDEFFSASALTAHSDTAVCPFACELHLKLPRHERTGVIFDPVTLLHGPSRECTNLGLHPELPQRVRETVSLVDTQGLLDRCEICLPRDATRAELCAAHTEDYVDQYLLCTAATAPSASTHLRTFRCGCRGHIDNTIEDAPFTFGATQQSTVRAAGSLLALTDAVARGVLRNGMAFVRPPGHHAISNRSQGFCYANNVVVAARHALTLPHIQRVLVLDWDVHHGNGTQELVESDKRILFVSLHRGDKGKFYPFTGFAEETGAWGNIVNVPFYGSKGMSDAEYASCMAHVVVPIARGFGPDMVFVSAGYDAAHGDQLGGYRVTPEGYAHLTHALVTHVHSRVVLALEGGYNAPVVAACATACLRQLMVDAPPPPPMPSALLNYPQSPGRILPSCRALFARLLCLHRPFHPSLPVLPPSHSFALPSSLFTPPLLRSAVIALLADSPPSSTVPLTRAQRRQQPQQQQEEQNK